nr:group II intron maturase-specific domain-containing protein [Paenibacillus piscarius]
MEERISRLNRSRIGWLGYFHLASAKTHLQTLNQWIRRRLRMCLWKQWKLAQTRIRKLRALGVPEWACFTMANSRRGAWEMSPENEQCPSDFLLGSKRAEKFAFTLSGTLLTFWNRRMRIRMYGGKRTGTCRPLLLDLWSFCIRPKESEN